MKEHSDKPCVRKPLV